MKKSTNVKNKQEQNMWLSDAEMLMRCFSPGSTNTSQPFHNPEGRTTNECAIAASSEQNVCHALDQMLSITLQLKYNKFVGPLRPSVAKSYV
jgi:hypothetical protein